VDDTDCTIDEMRSALDHSLGFQGNSEFTDNHSRMLVSSKVHAY